MHNTWMPVCARTPAQDRITISVAWISAFGQHGPHAGFQRWQMPLDDGGDGRRIDVAQVVVHQDVAEPGDVVPRDLRAAGLLVGRQVLGGFGQRLEVAQGGIVEDVVLGQAPRAWMR
ncbi:MAG: hypothetical protein QM614_09830 [Ottowia sp.]